MREVERSILIKAAPLRVWTALADFDGFKRWHPFIRLAGLRGVLLIEEIYEISGVPSGTEVWHRMLWRGFLARIPLVNTRLRRLRFLEESDAALERHFRQAMTTVRPLSRSDRRAAKRRAP